jgi:peptide/nickel transport system permease protein
MPIFLLRRILGGLVQVFVVTVLTFLLLNMTGTNAARNIVGQNATQAQVEIKTKELGLDQPLPARYVSWLGKAVTLDLGASWTNAQPVTRILGAKLPVTLSIIFAGLFLSAIISILIGILAAVRGGWLDRAVQVTAIVGFAIPSFLIGLVLAATLAVKLGWFPAVGFVSPGESVGGWLRSITLPAVALAIGAIAATAQQLRGSVVDVLSTDYVRTLRSRGLPERSILFRHALRNAAPPALTVLALQFIGLVGGAVIVEKVFGLAGIGSEALSSSSRGDQPVVLGIVTVMVVLIVIVNLVLDVVYGWLNPKVRVA